MELWIISQDKRHLLKVDIINWFGGEIYTNNQVNLETEKDGETYLLGRYCNGKRALEVLDEIRQRLIDLQTLEIAPDSHKIIRRNMECVYEMPKE